MQRMSQKINIHLDRILHNKQTATLNVLGVAVDTGDIRVYFLTSLSRPFLLEMLLYV